MTEERLRLDKWLWHARFYKSRTLAAAACVTGRIRLGGASVDKAHQTVKPGDVLTFPLGTRIRVVRIMALASRRGPAVEARALYEDLSPPTEDEAGSGSPATAVALREPGSGRPSKAERRALDRLRHVDVESDTA